MALKEPTTLPTDGQKVETRPRPDNGSIPSAFVCPSLVLKVCSRVGDAQLFYLISRGLTKEEAMALIVRGFIEPIAKQLPLEYAVELNRLIELEMEGSVG